LGILFFFQYVMCEGTEKVSKSAEASGHQEEMRALEDRGEGARG
jgi:hypothetical protein